MKKNTSFFLIGVSLILIGCSGQSSSKNKDNDQLKELKAPVMTNQNLPETSQDVDFNEPEDAYFDWQTYRNEEYKFEFKYPKSDWRFSENEDYPYLGGTWYAEKPGMTISMCIHPDRCQDSTIRISVIEQAGIDFVMDKEKEFSYLEIEDSQFLGNEAKIIIMSEWKEIIFEKNDLVFLIGGWTKPDTEEAKVFEKLTDSFRILE